MLACFTTNPHFFSTSTYIRQYTYPCTCVLRVCVHLRLHTSHACKRVCVCMSRQDAIYTQLRIHLCSLAHVYIYMRTHALTTGVQFATTLIDMCAHMSWRIVMQPMFDTHVPAHGSCACMPARVHACTSEACLYMSIHVPHARVSMLLCTPLNTHLHTPVHHPQVPWRYVRICHLAHIT